MLTSFAEYTIIVADVTKLTDDELNKLHCGDRVIKEDATGQHLYFVSFKKDFSGICITYTDCSCVETVSYDYTDGAWVFNSKDVTPLGE